MSFRSVTRLSLFGLVGLGTVAAPAMAHALDPFTNGSDNLGNAELSSGVALGVADMNNDGLDDIVRLDGTRFLELEYQQDDGSFMLVEAGDLQGFMWSISIADVDGNGYADIFTGGAYDDLIVLKGADDGSGFTTDRMPQQVFVQCSNFADIDNNGTLDMFVCHDDGLSRPYTNDGDGNFELDYNLINAESTIPSDNSGNYGTVWTDYDNDGDIDLYISKCRLGVNEPMDGRRVNLLFQNDGSGNYTDVAESAGVRPLAQSWAADFGDIDNDGDFDMFLLNHYSPSVLYRNDGPDNMGEFTDITVDAGISADLQGVSLGLQTHFTDFDNDGWVDFLISGTDGSEHRLFLNNGDGTFTSMEDPFPTNRQLHSFAIGDLNNDGFPDVMAGFASFFNEPTSNTDQLYLNAGNDNNWINIRLKGVESNPSAVGARLELHGEWGMQIREVRAGESYGISNSLTRHFGIGMSEEIERLVIKWPSGNEDTIEDPPLNQTIEVTEGCTTPYFADADGDGAGDPNNAGFGCEVPEGFVEVAGDCDDDDENNYPDNEEVCDEADNNCDGEADEGLQCGGEDTSTGAGDTESDTIDPSGGTGSSTTGEPPGTSTAAVTDGGGTDGEDTDGDTDAGQDSDSGGCGCDVDAPRGGAFSLVLLGLLSLGRRRRR